jgi:hypothetical protein
MAWLVLPRTLYDLIHRRANLRIQCLQLGCGHTSDFDAREIIELFRARRWNMAWEMVAGHFRCDRCGGKNCRADMTPAPEPPPRPISPLRKAPRPMACNDDPTALRRQIRIVGGRDAEVDRGRNHRSFDHHGAARRAARLPPDLRRKKGRPHPKAGAAI